MYTKAFNLHKKYNKKINNILFFKLLNVRLLLIFNFKKRYAGDRV